MARQTIINKAGKLAGNSDSQNALEHWLFWPAKVIA